MSAKGADIAKLQANERAVVSGDDGGDDENDLIDLWVSAILSTTC